MAIAASGAVSLSDLRTEFVGGSSAISFSDLYRGGSNILTKAGDNPAVNLAADVPTSGVIDIQDFYSTAKGFKNTVSSSTTNVDADALFGDDYDVNYPKIIDINSGVTIGGNGDEAIDIPSGLAGSLTINNAGIVIGFGGASAGAAGGSAINCATSGVTINNSGQISGGGGAGNVGGTGGNGSYSTSSTTYYYNGPSNVNVWFWFGEQGEFKLYRNSSFVGTVYGFTTSSGLGYVKGPQQYRSGSDYYYSIGVSSSSTTSTSGGSGGSFGVGAGYNQSAANGASGASGGTNAGSGGAGSNGAALGTAAATSSAGANGNASNGAAGNAGGAAGAAVTGTSVTMNNTGTLHGAVA